MQTYANFVAAVKARYYKAGSPGETDAYRAIADYAKSRIVRDVNRDIQLAKSFRDSYKDALVELAGYTITSTFAQVKAAVNTLLLVDGNVPSTAQFVDACISEAIGEINGMKTQFDRLVLEAAIDLQRHVTIYRIGHTDTLLAADVETDGFASIYQLTYDQQLRSVRHGLYYAPLAADTYAENDITSSNGRLYICTIGGVVTTPDIGDGLLSIDSDEVEVIGGATFAYYGPVVTDFADKLKWTDRDALLQGKVCAPSWTVNPGRTVLWFSPALDEDHRIEIEWDGLKQYFDDSDETPFDRNAEAYAAEYVRAKLTEGSMAMAQAALRRAWVDGEDRLRLD